MNILKNYKKISRNFFVRIFLTILLNVHFSSVSGSNYCRKSCPKKGIKSYRKSCPNRGSKSCRKSCPRKGSKSCRKSCPRKGSKFCRKSCPSKSKCFWSFKSNFDLRFVFLVKFHPRRYMISKKYDFKFWNIKKVHLEKDEPNDQYRLYPEHDYVCT